MSGILWLASLVTLLVTPNEWVLDHGIPIRTGDPWDHDFGDLEPLKDILEDVRVVQLGEQSHGDGAAFHMKCRLIAFLHQEMGFDVLAWESGLFDCAVMEERLHSDVPVFEAAAQGAFGIWSASREALPVFEYARQTHDSELPLEMSGFDCQFSGRAQGEYAGYVRESIEKWRLPFDEVDRADFFKIVEGLNLRDVKSAAVTQVAGIVERWSAILDEVEGEEVDREREFFRRTLENFAIFLEEMYLMSSPEGLQEGSNLRDIRMGENIVWLADEYYPDRKIIVWAASRHIAHDLPGIDTLSPSFSYEKYRVQGDVVHRELGDEAYTILFTALEGKAGTISRDPFDLADVPADSFEAWCAQSGEENLFLDLRGLAHIEDSPLTEPFLARPFGYAMMKGAWWRHADAFLYNRTMYPSTRYQPDSSDERGGG